MAETPDKANTGISTASNLPDTKGALSLIRELKLEVSTNLPNDELDQKCAECIQVFESGFEIQKIRGKIMLVKENLYIFPRLKMRGFFETGKII